MKKIIVAATALLSAGVLGAVDDSGVTFIGHEQVGEGRTVALATAPNLSISISHRTEPGMVEVHDKETQNPRRAGGLRHDRDGRQDARRQHDGAGQQRGTDIEGGQARELTAGDVMVIPAGVAHWFKTVPSSIDYYVVKVIAP